MCEMREYIHVKIVRVKTYQPANASGVPPTRLPKCHKYIEIKKFPKHFFSLRSHYGYSTGELLDIAASACVQNGCRLVFEDIPTELILTTVM